MSVMMFEGGKNSFWGSIWRGLIAVAVLAVLFSYPRTPPRSTMEKWSSGFPLHPFRWSTFSTNLTDMLHRIVTFSPGQTLDGQSIIKLVSVNLWPSVILLSLSLLFALILGVTKGVFDGIRTQKTSLSGTISGVVEWTINSVPDFFFIFGLELLGFFLLRKGIKVYFVGSHVFWSGTLIPAFVLSLAPMMYLARAVKVSVSDQLGQLYIQTARSKGLGNRAIVWHHIIPNCLPVISRNLGPMMGVLFGGLVIVEYLFGRKGIGSALFFAMGHDGVSPIYGTPMGHPPVAIGHPFDVNLCVAFMVAAVFVFLVFWLVLSALLRIVGFRGIASSYGTKMEDSASGKRWSGQLVIGVVMFAILLALALLKHHIGLPNPNQIDAIHMNNNSISTPPFPPSPGHWLGTDSDGRDLLSRCIYGIGPTLFYVVLSDLFVISIGITLAVLSSSFNIKSVRFLVDTWNSVTSVIPGVILALLMLEIPAVYWAGVHIGPGRVEWGHIHQFLFICVLAIIEGGRVAGQLQGILDTEHKRSYMESAMVSGNSNWTRFLIYDLRPLRDGIAEQFIITFTRILLVMATLGFFEDVFQPEWLKVNFGTWEFSGTSLDWGSLFAQNARDFLTTPWVMFPTSLFVAWTAVSVNLIQIGVHRLLYTTSPRKSRRPSLMFKLVASIHVRGLRGPANSRT